MLLLLAACSSSFVMPVRVGPPLVLPDTGALPDTAIDTAIDTAGETGGEAGETGETAQETGDTGAPPDTGGAYEVCWLGPARDHSVCVPTVPYDASFGSDYDYPSPYGGSAQYAEPVRYVDLEAIDPDLAIAPNFVLSEYAEAYKGQWGILQGHHVEELQAIRDAIGGPLVVTSGYRSPAYNAGVGGVTYSRHQYGDGADLDADGWSVEELGEICEDLGADYVGLYEDGHTHCDWRDAPLDPAFYGSAMRAAFPPPPPPVRATLVADGPAWTAPAVGFDEGEPLRRWDAWSADGALLTSELGRRFTPPPGTARFRVTVGGTVELYGP